MRFALALAWALLGASATASAQVSIGIGLPSVSIGINVGGYPDLVPVPGYPVYYAPQMDSNLFFFDGLYWVYSQDRWYASSWYDGPWDMVAPEAVPYFVLRVPVRYYRRPPSYFRGWGPDAPPRWGDHWGRDWAQRHGDWDRWDRASAPPPAPLPRYQREYSGNRYPTPDRQRELREQNYHYAPREAVVRQQYSRPAPAHPAARAAPAPRTATPTDARRGTASPADARAVSGARRDDRPPGATTATEPHRGAPDRPAASRDSAAATRARRRPTVDARSHGPTANRYARRQPRRRTSPKVAPSGRRGMLHHPPRGVHLPSSTASPPSDARRMRPDASSSANRNMSSSRSRRSASSKLRSTTATATTSIEARAARMARRTPCAARTTGRPPLRDVSASGRRFVAGTSTVRAVAAATVLSLAGCASRPPAPPLPPAAAVPDAWSIAVGSAGADTDADWWLRFKDPMLATLVQDASRANPTVLGARAAVQASRAQRDLAAAALWPVLSAAGSAQHGTAGGHSTGSTFGIGLDGSWVPDVFGAGRAGMAAAAASLEASAATLGDAQASIAAEVGLDYIGLRGSQARLAIATVNLASQLETLQITQWRQQAGLVTELESAQALALAEQTRALLPVLSSSIAQSSHALAVLTGRTPAALDARLAVAGPVPGVDEQATVAIPADVLRRRADVRAAEHAVSAALARVSQAQAARWPGFSLSGSLGLTAGSVGTLTNAASAVTALLASVGLPLIDGGARRAEVRARQAALEQARVTYVGTVLGALRDVEDALIALQGDRQRLVSLSLAASAAADAASLARQRYRSGLVDFQTVLDSQRTQLSTQDGVASARTDVSSDRVRLYRAAGGGWHDASDPAAPPAHAP